MRDECLDSATDSAGGGDNLRRITAEKLSSSPPPQHPSTRVLMTIHTRDYIFAGRITDTRKMLKHSVRDRVRKPTDG